MAPKPSGASASGLGIDTPPTGDPSPDGTLSGANTAVLIAARTENNTNQRNPNTTIPAGFSIRSSSPTAPFALGRYPRFELAVALASAVIQAVQKKPQAHRPWPTWSGALVA